MIFRTRTGKPLPAALTSQVGRIPSDAVSRREFLALASAFGASAATAYAMLGSATPAQAQTTPRQGGTVRTQAQVRALKDPRTFDYTETANFARGWLESLVTYENDGTFTPTLLESWEINDNATEYRLNVRKGVTWNDGTPFTAADVAFNIARWCDRTVEGNSMPGRDRKSVV